MKLGSGVVLVAVGLVVLWLAVTGRLSNLAPAWATLNSDGTDDTASANPTSGASGARDPAALATALGVAPDILSTFPVTPPVLSAA